MNFIELAKLMMFDYEQKNLKHPNKIAMTDETFFKMANEFNDSIFAFDDSIYENGLIRTIFGMEIEIRNDIDPKVLFIID